MLVLDRRMKGAVPGYDLGGLQVRIPGVTICVQWSLGVGKCRTINLYL